MMKLYEIWTQRIQCSQQNRFSTSLLLRDSIYSFEKIPMQTIKTRTISPKPHSATTMETDRPTNGTLARFTRGFRALEVRNYRLYWIGQLISQTGSWMQRT